METNKGNQVNPFKIMQVGAGFWASKTLIETPEGYDFSGADFNEWAKEIGFNKTSIMPLTGPSSAAIAIK